MHTSKRIPSYDVLTKGLNSNVHLGLRRMGNGISAELDIGAEKGVRTKNRLLVSRIHSTHFFMMIYLRALPRVWPSFKNSNEAAVGVEPGSCVHLISVQ